MFRFCLLAAALLAAVSPTASARVWTNDVGVTFRADFVRVVGDMAVLNQQGKTLTLKLSALSEMDQDWLDCAVECGKTRDWTTFENKVFRGRFKELEKGYVTIRTRGGNERIALEELIEEDRRLVTTLEEVPMVAGKPRQPKEETQPDAAPKADADGYRVWTATSGKKIAAKYHGKEGDVVVLFFNNREWRVPLAKLSKQDRRHVESLNEQGGAVMFDDLEPEDSPPLEAVAEASPQGEPDTLPGGFPKPRAWKDHEDFVAEAEARAEEMRRDMERRMEERRRERERRGAAASGFGADEPHDVRVETRNGERRVWADGAEVYGAEADRVVAWMEQQEQEREAEARAREEERRQREEEREREHSERRAEWERRATERRMEPVVPMIHEYECFSCNKTFESTRELGVGDRCPHCRVKFDSLSDENGEIIAESSTAKARRYGGLAKLVIFGVLGLGSFLGWLVKK